jgi:hypothetical protein
LRFYPHYRRFSLELKTIVIVSRRWYRIQIMDREILKIDRLLQAGH